MKKLALQQEKAQIRWGVEVFLKFLTFAAKKGGISPSQAATLQRELEELAEAAFGEDTPEVIAGQLNHYISMVNTQMKQNSDPARYAPFPPFSFARGAYLQSAVLDQVDMVERTLTEAAEAELLNWDDESNTFTNLLKVFSQVESEKMLPVEGMARLVGELEKINQLLPKEFQIPLPDLSMYE